MKVSRTYLLVVTVISIMCLCLYLYVTIYINHLDHLAYIKYTDIVNPCISKLNYSAQKYDFSAYSYMSNSSLISSAKYIVHNDKSIISTISSSCLYNNYHLDMLSKRQSIVCWHTYPLYISTDGRCYVEIPVDYAEMFDKVSLRCMHKLIGSECITYNSASASYTSGHDNHLLFNICVVLFSIILLLVILYIVTRTVATRYIILICVALCIFIIYYWYTCDIYINSTPVSHEYDTNIKYKSYYIENKKTHIPINKEYIKSCRYMLYSHYNDDGNNYILKPNSASLPGKSKYNKLLFGDNTLFNTLEDLYGLVCWYGSPIYLGKDDILYVKLPLDMAILLDEQLRYFDYMGLLEESTTYFKTTLSSMYNNKWWIEK